MEKIQIQAARKITGTNNYAHKNLLYLETGWEKLSKRRAYHRLILLYKILNYLAPEHLRNIFLNCTNFNNGYNLRHNNIQLIYSRTETFRSSLFPCFVQTVERARSISKKHGFFVKKECTPLLNHAVTEIMLSANLH